MFDIRDIKKHHRKTVNEFRDKVIKKRQRSVVWLDRDSLSETLEQALDVIEVIFDRFESRFFLAFDTFGASAERIELSNTILHDTLARGIINDTTDNLILTSILDHARSHPSEEKAFLSGDSKAFHDNQEAQKALKELGIKYFRKGRDCLDWLDSLHPPRPPGLGR